MLSSKPWRADLLLRLFALLLLCFAGGAIVAEILRRILGDAEFDRQLLPMLISIVCLHGTALVGIALFVRAHGISWPEAFGFNRAPGWAVLLGIGAAILALPACRWLEGEMSQWLSRHGFNVGEQEAVHFLREADSVWKQVVLAVFAIGLAPVVEEIIFRGIIYPMIKQRGFPRLALFGSAFLFALIHGNIVVIVPLFTLAVVLTLLYEWTDNLLTCIVVHGLFNAANFVMLFAQKYSWPIPGTG